MIPLELGIALIILAIFASAMYMKMILIWRDVMIKRHESMVKDMERLEELKKQINN